MSSESAKNEALTRKAAQPVTDPRMTAMTGAEISFGVGVAASFLLTYLLPDSVPYFEEIVAAPIILGLGGGAAGGYIYGLLEKHKQEKAGSALSPQIDPDVIAIVHKLSNQTEMMVSLNVTPESSQVFVKQRKTVTLSETGLSTFHKPGKLEQIQDEPLRDAKQSKIKRP